MGKLSQKTTFSCYCHRLSGKIKIFAFKCISGFQHPVTGFYRASRFRNDENQGFFQGIPHFFKNAIHPLRIGIVNKISFQS